jgi:hypothetical protein
MAYDIEGARQSKIPDAESLQHLADTYNYDLEGARQANISDEESLAHLIALPKPKEPVVEKESPEVMGTLTGGAGAIGKAADVIYSKGRPLFRLGQKALQLNVTDEPTPQRKFSDIPTVAQRAIDLREPTEDLLGSSKQIRNWTVGKPGSGMGSITTPFYGGAEYGEAFAKAKEAKAWEEANPGKKIDPLTGNKISEEHFNKLMAERAEAARLQDIKSQAEVNKVAQIRAERLAERDRLLKEQNKAKMFSGTGSIVGPILGGYQLGSQGAQAYNRLTRPDLQLSDVLSGGANVAGAGLAGAAMLPAEAKYNLGKYRIPGVMGSAGLAYLANLIDRRNPRNEEPEQNAVGQASNLFSTALGFLPGALGLMASPSSLGAATTQPKATAYEPGMSVLSGSKLPQLAGGGQPSVQQIQSNISPQEQAIVDYHRNTIASGNIGRDDHNNPVTVYSSTVDIPSGLHAGKVATVPGYYDNQIHNDPREIYARWAEQIDQGKWPIYYDPRTGDTRAKYIHGIMDQEKPK